MKRNNLIDFLIILLVSIALSCLPFNYINSHPLFIIICQIVAQVGCLLFKFFYLKKTSLSWKRDNINLKKSLVFIPTLLVCFSNYLYIILVPNDIVVNFDYLIIFRIILTLLVAFNEEIIFRLLLINNLETTSNIKKVLLSACVFALCHLTGFLSTFNPFDLISVAYTFALGLLLGIVFVKTNSIMPTFIIHLFFNIFNQVIFESLCGSYSNMPVYIISNVFVALLGALYVGIYLLIELKKKDIATN